MHGTRLGKQGRRIAGRSYGSSEAEAEFGTQNAGATHARRTAQGPSTIAHPNRERPCVCHSSKPSQVARSRPRLPRQKNRRPELASRKRLLVLIELRGPSRLAGVKLNLDVDPPPPVSSVGRRIRRSGSSTASPFRSAISRWNSNVKPSIRSSLVTSSCILLGSLVVRI